MSAPVAPNNYRLTLGATAVRFLVAALMVVGVFTALSGLMGITPVYWMRLASYFAIAALAAAFRHRQWIGLASLGSFYVLWWVMAIVDIASDVDFGYSERMTMALSLLILGLAIPPLSPVRMTWLVPSFAALNGTWILITGLQTSVTWPVLADELVAGVLGYLLLSIMTRRLLEAADRHAEVADRWGRLQQTLTKVSETLLASPAEGALQSAVESVRQDMGWDVVAIEEIVCLESGITHRPVSVAGDAGLERLTRGTLETIPALASRMCSSDSFEIDVPSLVGSEREGYAGVNRELACPIRVGGHVVGIVSVLSTSSEYRFGDDESRLLRRIAEMVGSYWERQQALERLEQMLESKDRFIASVSHELRTPLTGVVGLAQLLARGGFRAMDADEMGELIDLIAVQSAEVGQIVEDLLVAARADSGLLTIRLQPVEVRAEVEAVIADLRGALRPEHSVTVSGERLVALADPLRLRQVLRNLVSNAIRYGGSQITVHVSASARRVELSVSDDGPGIPYEKRELVFEPYATAHATAGLPGSMGLGLSVSRDLARLMGGDLRLAADGDGTTFVVSLEAIGVDTSTIHTRTLVE